MIEPTYVQSEIDANPVWRLAWRFSELYNDNAPIGWSEYIPMAEAELSTAAADEAPEGEE